MRLRVLALVGIAALYGSVLAAQMPPPSPSATPPPSPTPPPDPTPPPGYACQDPDNGVWVAEGGSRTKVTNPTLTGGKKTVTEVYICKSGKWKLQMRSTIWSSSTGVATNPPGAIAENGNRKEWFDLSTGCQTWMDEMIGRTTKTRADIFSSVLQDDRCIWTQHGDSCTDPASTYDMKIERWNDVYLGGTITHANAGYTETVDSVGYDSTGALVQDFHSNYKRNTPGDDGPIVTTVGIADFEVNYYETGQTVAHPMSYYALALIKGGPSGNDVWSGMAKIPQYDPLGNFTGYATQTIGQILARAHTHEYLLCGGDDGTGYPWWPLAVKPPIP